MYKTRTYRDIQAPTKENISIELDRSQHSDVANKTYTGLGADIYIFTNFRLFSISGRDE